MSSSQLEAASSLVMFQLQMQRTVELMRKLLREDERSLDNVLLYPGLGSNNRVVELL